MFYQQKNIREIVAEGIEFPEKMIDGKRQRSKRPVILRPVAWTPSFKIKITVPEKLGNKRKAADIGISQDNIFFVEQKIVPEGNAVENQNNRADHERTDKNRFLEDGECSKS